MIGVLSALALASVSANQSPITCTVLGDYITVRFNEHDSGDIVIDKFAVVQAGTLRGGEWLTVVDTDSPQVRFSPYRPGMKRLVIDTRSQLANRWETGRRPVRAFPKPGLYTLVFADSLGIDLEDMAEWSCRVRIRH